MRTVFRTALVGLALAGVAGAAVADAEKAIKARKGYMQVMSFNMAPLGAMVKGKMDYDADTANTAAANLHLLAMMKNGAMWPKGSDEDSMMGVAETRALPAIWEAGSDVGEKLKALTDATADLEKAAGNGLEAMTAAFKPVGQACGSCHKKFRASKN